MPRRARLSSWLLAAAWLPAIVAASLRAADPPAAVPKSFLDRDSPLPDPGGLRASLADRGVNFGLLYTGEITGNPAGGYRQGAVYDGLITAGLDVDLGKLARLPGLKFHALAYYAHGASGTDKYVRDLNRFSNIDAFDSVRLFELWLETALFGNVINLRAGQVALDSEFTTTQGGALFLSSNFGALPVLTLNVPSSIYPQAAPGVRLRLQLPRRPLLPPGRRLYRQPQRRPRRRPQPRLPRRRHRRQRPRRPLPRQRPPGRAHRFRSRVPREPGPGRPRPARRLPGRRLLPHRDLLRPARG